MSEGVVIGLVIGGVVVIVAAVYFFIIANKRPFVAMIGAWLFLLVAICLVKIMGW